MGLVAHAQRAAGHLSAGTGCAEVGVVAFFDQLALVHLGRWRNPQLDGNVTAAAEQLGGGAEVADVGHARTDEGFVDLGAGHVGQELGVVRVVGAAQDRLFDLVHVDLDDVRVLGVLVGFEQVGRVEPGLNLLDAALQRALVFVAVGDHVLHEHDIGLQVLLDRLFVQLDRATCSRTLGRRVGQLKRLLDLEVGQAFDFQDAAGELVDLAGLGNSQKALLDGIQRNRVHQIAQGHARLHFAFETHQDRLGHVQRHHAGGGTEGHQTGACGEGNADGETGVRIATSAHGVGQQQTVEPAVDHAITGAQRNAAAVADEGRQFAVGLDVHGLGVSGGVAEGLHDHVGAETQAGQVFQLVAGHRAGGVL